MIQGQSALLLMFKQEMQYEKETIIRVRIEKSIPGDHRLSSVLMPNGDPRDCFFYPTLMKDSYKLI